MRMIAAWLCDTQHLHHGIVRRTVLFFILSGFLASASVTSAALFEKTCGSDNTGGKKVLVAYDSKHGSTALIAETIGDVLCENGCQVDIRLAVTVDEIAAYDAIVLGSPLYYSNFLPGALSFLDRHRSILVGKKVAIFAVSTSVDTETGLVNPNVERLVVSSVLNKFPELQVIEPIGLMPGKYFFREIFPVEVINLKQTGLEEPGDLLNIDIVKAWAEGLCARLE
jgi:menaquinone-dependent protoporphyrinogen oxidase